MNKVIYMNKKKKILEYLPYISIIIIIILIRLFIATPVRVTGDSMYPNLKNGEIMILNKLAKIDRYDIVVVNKRKTGEEIIKRVIGMPGDSVLITDNKLYINDEEIEDVYAYGDTEDIYKVFLGDDEYYVLGDNREISLDSRTFGKITKKDIKGVADLIVFPFNKFGKVEKK